MGRSRTVAFALQSLIETQIKDHGIVVWYDPDNAYESAVDDLSFLGAKVVRWSGSHYGLRAEVEPFLRTESVPKLVVYVPLDQAQTSNALIELETFGVVVRPGQQPLARNTRLSVVARAALKPFVSDGRLEEIVREIEGGRLTLADLEALAVSDQIVSIPSVLSLIYRTTDAEELALNFLNGQELDVELSAKSAVKDLIEVLNQAFGAVLDPKAQPTQIREVFARQVLISDLAHCLGDLAERILKTVTAAGDSHQRSRCALLAGRWRDHATLGSRYLEAANKIEKVLHLESFSFAGCDLGTCSTFRTIELHLIKDAAVRVDSQLARERLSTFWSRQDPEINALWTLVLHAADLIEIARRVSEALVKKPHTSAELLGAYSEGESPWCLLDTIHRRLARLAGTDQIALTSIPDELEQLLAKAWQAYHLTTDQVGEAFLKSFRASGFRANSISLQRKIFFERVQPSINQGRVAYVLVDALRFEMGRELASVLQTDFEVDLRTAVAEVPTVTPVGMAGLMPGAESGLEITEGKSAIEVRVAGQLVRNRKDRVDLIRTRFGEGVVDLKLEDLSGFKKKLKEVEKGARFVLLTSQEIDASGEQDFTAARQTMDNVLGQLSAALRRLASAGIETFVVTADHGYIYGDPAEEGMKIDPPGKGVLCDRRAWVGKGGTDTDSFLRTPLSQFGSKTDLDYATPWNTAVFRAGGGTAYYHGGLLPQELLIPVLILRPKSWLKGEGAAKIHWELSIGSAKITTRFLTVQIRGRIDSLLDEAWPLVKIEVRSGKTPVSVPVGAVYGFSEETGEIELRAVEEQPKTMESNTVTLMLTGAITGPILSVALIDANTGRELKKIENVEVSIAF